MPAIVGSLEDLFGRQPPSGRRESSRPLPIAEVQVGTLRELQAAHASYVQFKVGDLTRITPSQRPHFTCPGDVAIVIETREAERDWRGELFSMAYGVATDIRVAVFVSADEIGLFWVEGWRFDHA